MSDLQLPAQEEQLTASIDERKKNKAAPKRTALTGTDFRGSPGLVESYTKNHRPAQALPHRTPAVRSVTKTASRQRGNDTHPRMAINSAITDLTGIWASGLTHRKQDQRVVSVMSGWLKDRGP